MKIRVRVSRLVPVQFLQDDMKSYEAALPYPVKDMLGKTLFTENVLFGEVWIAERTSRKTRWSGHILNGDLYLDETIRRKGVVQTRPPGNAVPSLLPAGKYKIWLDAWCRIGDFPKAYGQDAPFTKDGAYSGVPDDLWQAPATLPDRRYWQEIEVTPPSIPGTPCRIYIRSRRFHFLYRLSRLIDTLDRLLRPHEYMVATVANVREFADHLTNFMAVELNSENNIAHILVNNREELEQMNVTIQNVNIACQNFINFGYAGDGSVCDLRQHINNVAALLWRLINYTPFQKDVAFYEPSFAEEHRIIISRIGSILNRIPVGCSGAEQAESGLYLRPVSISDPWGQKCAQEFTLPYYNHKAQEYGHPPPFKFQKEKPAVAWLNSTRRYGVSLLNAASIFVSKTAVDREKLKWLLEVQSTLNAEYHAVESTASIVMPAIDASIEKFSKAGNVAKATKWKGVREALVKERRALSQEGFRLGLNPDLDAELKDLEQQMLKVQGDIEAVQKREPQKILDGLKKKNPKALYAIEGFDTFVKAWVAKAAWNEFVMSAGEPPAESAKKAADATFRTLDCTGTIFKSSGIEKLLQWGWKDRLGVSTEEAAKIFGKWGTGLGALADIGAASVYTYDVFYSQAYASKLDETYLPSDALAIHAWHLVIWEGKWIVAIGSTSGFLGAGPFGTRLQAIGYLFQLVGEVGEAFAKFGKVEKRHYVDVLLQMRLWAMNARARLKDNGCDMDFYPDSTHQKMRDCIDKFTWWPVSPTEYRAVFGLANLPAGKAG